MGKECDQDWYVASAEPEWQLRDAGELFSRYLGSLWAYCCIFPLAGPSESCSPSMALRRCLQRGSERPAKTTALLHGPRQDGRIHSYWNYFLQAVDAFGYCWHQLKMPVVKVASAGTQSNCFDRPWDVQRKRSSIFSFLLVRNKHLSEDTTAQGNSSVQEFKSRRCMRLVVVHGAYFFPRDDTGWQQLFVLSWGMFLLTGTKVRV